MDLIALAFIQHRQHLVYYVNARVNDYARAEDIVQDAFLRLLEVQVGVRADSVKSLLFTTCRHLICDELRHQKVVEDANIYMYAQRSHGMDDTDQLVRVHDLEEHEQRIVGMMPNKQRHVYCLSQYEGKSVAEISEQLHISPRTVEAHLYVSRKTVREQLKAFAS